MSFVFKANLSENLNIFFKR